MYRYKDKKGISGTQAGKMTREDKLIDSGNAPDAEDFIFSLCLGVLIMYTGNTYSRVQCVHLLKIAQMDQYRYSEKENHAIVEESPAPITEAQGTTGGPVVKTFAPGAEVPLAARFRTPVRMKLE